MGGHLGGTAAQLYAGVPNAAPHGAAYAQPWSNATGGRTGATGTATAHAPGQNGLPATGTAFGRAVN